MRVFGSPLTESVHIQSEGYGIVTEYYILNYYETSIFLPLYAANPPVTELVLYPLRANSLAAAILAPPLSQ